MRHFLTSFLTCLALAAAPALAQTENGATSCADLTVTGTGASGAAMTIAVSGSLANAYTAVLISDAAADQAIKLGSDVTLLLGVAIPFVAVPMDMTDAAGASSLSFDLPTLPEGFEAMTFYLQAVSGTFDFVTLALSVCESDVETMTIGG